MDRRRFLTALSALAATVQFSPTAFARSKVAPEIGLWLFTQDIYHQLAQLPESGKVTNLFLSPFSIAIALAMTARGAAGTTLSEMSQVLHWPLDQPLAHVDLGHMISNLIETKVKDSPQIEIANSLFGSSESFFKPDFKNSLKQEYHAGLQPVNFKQPELARRQINQWVEAQTHDKIKELFPASVINELTRLVLVNAIYFKGAWRHRFEKAFTQDVPFYGTTEVKVPMMQLTESLRYSEGPNYQAVELPYRNSDLAMVVVLPRNRNPRVDLVAIEPKPIARDQQQISFAKNVSWLDEMKTQTVQLSLPRFHSRGRFSEVFSLSWRPYDSATSGQWCSQYCRCHSGFVASHADGSRIELAAFDHLLGTLDALQHLIIGRKKEGKGGYSLLRSRGSNGQ